MQRQTLYLLQASDPNVFVIPPMWKRIVAEVLDFLILFVLKIMITFIAVDAFDLVDLENYDLPVAFDLLNLDPDNLKIDYNFAVQLTQEILLLELVHRSMAQFVKLTPHPLDLSTYITCFSGWLFVCLRPSAHTGAPWVCLVAPPLAR